jgi:hypothetical protein
MAEVEKQPMDFKAKRGPQIFAALAGIFFISSLLHGNLPIVSKT